MIVLFVNQEADGQGCQRIEGTQQMVLNGGQIPLDHNKPEILDITIHGVQEEQLLNHRRIAVHPIENGRQVVQKRQKNIIQILRIPEENIHGGQDHTDTDIECK